jgi:hypothetical protein
VTGSFVSRTGSGTNSKDFRNRFGTLPIERFFTCWRSVEELDVTEKWGAGRGVGQSPPDPAGFDESRTAMSAAPSGYTGGLSAPGSRQVVGQLASELMLFLAPLAPPGQPGIAAQLVVVTLVDWALPGAPQQGSHYSPGTSWRFHRRPLPY